MTVKIENGGIYDSGAYQTLRGLNKADKFSDSTDTSIMDLADKKAQNEPNKSGITVALEDFSNTFQDFNGHNSSNITINDTKNSFFDNAKSIFGQEDDNMFKTQEGQDLLNKKGSIFQNDIFASDIAKYGGIKYAKDGDNIASSAVNFAKADAYAIGKANEIANGGTANDSIDSCEVKSYKDFDGSLKETFQEMNIAGADKSLSPKEYASYLMAVDGLVQSEDGAEFDAQKIDGLITPQEAQAAKNLDNEQFQELAQKIYEENF